MRQLSRKRLLLFDTCQTHPVEFCYPNLIVVWKKILAYESQGKNLFCNVRLCLLYTVLPSVCPLWRNIYGGYTFVKNAWMPIDDGWFSPKFHCFPKSRLWLFTTCNNENFNFIYFFVLYSWRIVQLKNEIYVKYVLFTAVDIKTFFHILQP